MIEQVTDSAITYTRSSVTAETQHKRHNVTPLEQHENKRFHTQVSPSAPIACILLRFMTGLVTAATTINILVTAPASQRHCACSHNNKHPLTPLLSFAGMVKHALPYNYGIGRFLLWVE